MSEQRTTSPERLRAMDYNNSHTGQEAFGIQAWVQGRWRKVGCHGGQALWLTEKKRDAALEWLLQQGCTGSLGDMLDDPSGEKAVANDASSGIGELWVPDAMAGRTP